MKVITTNRLNRFWLNGVKPIKDALGNKLNTASVINNLLTTAAGYALDARQGKVLDDKITELNRKLSGISYADGYVLVNCGSLPNNSTKYVDISLPVGVTDWWISEAWFRNPNLANYRYTLPHIDIAAWSNSVSIDIGGSRQIILVTTSTWSGYNAYAIVSYKL